MVQIPQGARLGFRIQPRYEALGDFRVEISSHSDQNRVSETSPLTVAQSWPWASQIADKRKKKKKQNP